MYPLPPTQRTFFPANDIFVIINVWSFNLTKYLDSLIILKIDQEINRVTVIYKFIKNRNIKIKSKLDWFYFYNWESTYFGNKKLR